MTLLWLKEPFQSAWRGKNAFEEVSAIVLAATNADIYRNKEGRKTLRFIFKGQRYFIKWHTGIGWKEITKNILQLRLPILGAGTEFYAAQKLHDMGIDTLTPVAYGNRHINPARKESFLITEDLINTISLEDFCKQWLDNPPDVKIKRALIKKVALIAKQIHEAGINHRDFYICHFLLENSAEEKIKNRQSFHCYLIDLHRCQKRTKVPKRWLIKDLGGLLYSTFDINLKPRDYYRFIRFYTGKSIKQNVTNIHSGDFWKEVMINAVALYKKDFKKEPSIIFKVLR